MELIERIEITSDQSSITFSDIAQDFQDLLVLFSGRTNRASTNDYTSITLNGSTTYESVKTLWGQGASNVLNTTDNSFLATNSTNARANTYNNASIYFANYRSTAKKSVSINNSYDGNTADSGEQMAALIFNVTSAITSISFSPRFGTVMKAGTKIYLYGIRSARSQAWATGGEVSYDPVNDKFYHVFTSSGTFTALAPIDVDYLVVAGGGGGGYDAGGGGGAGGYQAGTATLSSTGYSVTVGAGGAGATGTGASGVNGSNSVFNAVTSTGGGGGGTSNGNTYRAAGSGGSGGGGAGRGSYSGTAPGGSGTSGQGNDGGDGSAFPGTNNWQGGGGGGASAAGQDGTSGLSTHGYGGDGTQWVDGNYYAGGGGGGNLDSGSPALGGTGGGGNGGISGTPDAEAGEANTGGGAGGAGRLGGSKSAAPAGGSGVVIISYDGTQAFKARGGTITTSGGYTYHTFESGGSFIPSEDLSVDYLLVAGGGGGGSKFSGGGGAGGYLAGTAQAVTANENYLVSVGAGGAKDANGSDTYITWGTAVGGGSGGGSNNDSGGDGGSGGGGAGNNYLSYPVVRSNWGDGTAGQGNRGGGGNRTAVGDYGGGGGGASAVGGNMTTTLGQNVGGAGSQWSDGNYYAGGGGGYRASGGVGGGGDGGSTDSTRPGEANTGGGGGGAWTGQGSASGGSGIVIIRYAS